MWPVSCAFTTAEVAEILELPRATLEADRKAGLFKCSYYPDFRETPLKGVHNLVDIVRYDLRHSIDVHGPERRLQDSALNALFWMHSCRESSDSPEFCALIVRLMNKNRMMIFFKMMIL